MTRIRLVLADDHPLVRRGICDFLNSCPDFQILAECADGKQALDAVRLQKPDLALLDLSMPHLDGLAVLAAAQEENLQTKIVFLSAVIDSRQIMMAMAQGAWGILLKDSSPEELLHCLRDVAAGNKQLPFELVERLRGQEYSGNTTPIDQLLTPREWNVAALAARGLSNKEIARKLNITEGTAKIHLHHAFRKLKVGNRASLSQVTFRPVAPGPQS